MRTQTAKHEVAGSAKRHPPVWRPWLANYDDRRKMDQWAAAHKDLKTDKLLKTAHQVIDRILGENSELAELWQDSESCGDWQAAVEDLRSRLEGT